MAFSEWPSNVIQDMRGAVEGRYWSPPQTRVARCRPKGLWVTRRRGTKTHMYLTAVSAWSRLGTPRLGAMTRCGDFLDDAISEMSPDGDNLCDRCLLAEIDGTCYLYTFLNAAGEVIYVGVSTNLAVRLESHKSNTPWWREIASTQLRTFPDEMTARRAERRLIYELRPKHNKDGNPDRGLRGRAVA